MKKIIFILGILFAFLSSAAYAADEKITDFTVTERNGVSVEGYMISRGIPVKQGFLNPDEALIVKDENQREIATQNKVLSKYSDGSVKWMQIAFLADLSPNETKEYSVYKSSGQNEENLAVTEANGTITANTGKISLSIDNRGMQKVIINGYNIFEADGTVSAYEPNDQDCYQTNGGTVELVENGPVYAQFLVKSPYSGGIMRTEQVYTIYKNSDKIGCDYKWVSCEGTRAGEDKVTSLYEQYNLQKDFSSFEYKDTSVNNENISKQYPIYSCDWVQAYNANADISFTMITKDVEKFRNYAGSICNGFINDGSKLIFSPILYKRGYDWTDGVSRTAHTDIFVRKGKSVDREAVLLTQKNTPAVVINPNVYYNAGITESAAISSAAACQIKAVDWMKGRTNGNYRAGYIPHDIDVEGGKFGGSDVALGETGFNMWYAQMLSGDADLYDVLIEHENEYIDDAIYEGAVTEGRGGGRYRIGLVTKNSTHAFYSEFSHLYMSYCMTGQEHYKRAMAEMADYVYRNAMATNLMGFHMVTTGAWTNGYFSMRNMAEIRYAFMIRAMYYSYEIFGDEKYLYIGDEVAKWVEATQEENGSWSQAYNEDGSNYYNTILKQVLFKNYIMLYALRGPAEYYRQTGCERLREPMIKFADYLLSEMQNDQWMWDPVADKSITETNEDMQRGNAPMQEIMATEILELVYDMTGEEKYFDGMCKFLRYYLGSMQNYGTAPQRYCYKDYAGGKVRMPMLGMTSTLSRIDNKLIAAFEKNRALAEKLGFKDLVDIFADGAIHSPEKVSGDYNYIDVTAHIFETEQDKWLYVVNHSGYNSEQIWEKTIDVKTRCDGYIWSDCENIIDNIYETKASRYYEIFEMATMKLLPIRVSEFTDTVKITAKTYDENSIELKVTGSSGTAGLEIHDGDFNITDGNKYYVSIVQNGNEKSIAVKADNNGNYTASDGKLTINLSFADNQNSYEDIQNHWAKSDIEAISAMGLLRGVGGNLFAPEGTVTKREFILMAMRVMGYQNDEEATGKAVELGIVDAKENLDEPVKRDEMTNICVKVLEQCRDMSDMRIETESHKIRGEIADDQEAVKADAESITLSDFEPTKNNLSLPYEGMYGSYITWESSDEDIISKEGIITKPPVGQEKTVTMTATIKRNNAEEKKIFELEVPDQSKLSYAANHPIANSLIRVNSAGAVFDFSFDAIAHGNGIDCVFGVMDSSGNYSDFTKVPMLIRFNTTGKIDAYSQNGYKAVEDVQYIPEQVYHFRVSGSCGSKTYNVTVTDADGKEYVIADNFEFRTTAQPTNKIDMICVDEPDGLAEVVRHDLALDTPLKGGGMKNAAEYFGTEDGDLTLSGSGFISGNLNIADNSGKIISVPERTTVVQFFKIPDEVKLFADFDEIGDQYKLSVIEAQMIQLAMGDNGYFYPGNTSTRAEAAVMIRRLNDLKKAGKIL